LVDKPHLFRSIITDGRIYKLQLISAPSTALVVEGSGLLVHGALITDCHKGIVIKASKVTVRGGSIVNATADCIHVATGSHIVVEKTLGCSGGGTGFTIGPVGAGNVIDDVDVLGYATRNTEYGIFIQSIAGEKGGEIKNVIFQNFQVYGFTKVGISLTQTSGSTFSNITFKVAGSGNPTAPTVVLSCAGGCKNVSLDKVDVKGAPAKCGGLIPLPIACTLAASQATEGLVVSADPLHPYNVAVRITNPPSVVPPWAAAMLALGSTLIVMVVIILILLATTTPKRRIEEL